MIVYEGDSSRQKSCLPFSEISFTGRGSIHNLDGKDMSNFENAVDRRFTACRKWDMHPELLPFWIADMDFASPECIIDALKKRLDHGVFGYGMMPDSLRETLVSYMKKSHGADIKAEWIVPVPGCVSGLMMCAHTFSAPGESYLSCDPVYPPIRDIPADYPVDYIGVPHIKKDGRWTFDMDALESAVRPDTRFLILCNPQNPLGISFREEEVIALARFCEKHNLILCSDEIHCDLVLDKDVKHFSAMCLPEPLSKRALILTAPSKTYNIAGLSFSFAVIPDDELREKFSTTIGHKLPGIPCISYDAAEAAYTEGEVWRQELLSYLRGNRDFLYEYIREQMPLLKLDPMESTYLVWIDCSALGMENPSTFFKKEAGVFLNDGAHFGAPQFVRFNLGTSRTLIEQGLSQMKKAIDTLTVS